MCKKNNTKKETFSNSSSSSAHALSFLFNGLIYDI